MPLELSSVSVKSTRLRWLELKILDWKYTSLASTQVLASPSGTALVLVRYKYIADLEAAVNIILSNEAI